MLDIEPTLLQMALAAIADVPKVVMSLEECLEYIKEDEYVEVTPKSMRMRKITLDHLERKRQNKE